MLSNTFESKTVLVTGHTGFKGSWLSLWLHKLGAKVVGLSEGQVSEPSHFQILGLSEVVDSRIGDIRDAELVSTLIRQVQPDFVFHLAAQALVKASYDDPLATIQTNVMGSANILQGLRDLSKPCSCVMITSDKAYENIETHYGYRETDRLGGADPYSASKGAAEIVVSSLIRSYFPTDGSVRVAVARAGNVIGGGDWAADRIVPDIARAWSNKTSLSIRNPAATRPWQHVLEPLSGYLQLAAELERSSVLHGEAFNFGPSAEAVYPVSDLVAAAEQVLPELVIEQGVASFHEAGLLKLCCDKALTTLGWKAVLDFTETMGLTFDWYHSYYTNFDPKKSELQIDRYVALAQERGLPWVA